MSSSNVHLCHLRIDEYYLQDFKATMDEHVFVTTTDPEKAALLPEGYASAVGNFLMALGINVTLQILP